MISLLLVPAALLARAMFGERLKVTLYTLAAVLISLTWFGPVVDPLPLANRLLLIAQCIAIAAVIGWDLRHGNLANAFPTRSPAVVRCAAIAMIVLLVLAVAASIIGAVGAARFLRNLGLGALGLALVLSIAMHLLYGLIVALTETRSLRIFRERPEVVHRFARRVLIVVALACWAVAMAQVLGLLDSALRLGDRVVTAEIQVGAAHIELRGIFVGLAVLVATYLVVSIVRFVLEVGLLPRIRLKHGIAFAISAVARYVLLTAGVFLAIAAMGIDLTKVTLLAGALGVGIGLGLQGVVNNFVSGLILLVERPISAGDNMQIGDVQGTVRKIGVRSTTIATAQGSEIIVPNAELISKSVTNWTLTDRRRKLEIDVSVARGADPESVMRGLEETASTIEGVAAEPSPRAWLTGFRDNSLDYRLHVWVGDIDRALAVQSALRTAIARKFTDAATATASA